MILIQLLKSQRSTISRMSKRVNLGAIYCYLSNFKYLELQGSIRNLGTIQYKIPVDLPKHGTIKLQCSFVLQNYCKYPRDVNGNRQLSEQNSRISIISMYQLHVIFYSFSITHCLPRSRIFRSRNVRLGRKFPPQFA